MYVSKDCPDCDKAKELLKEKNIIFEATEIGTKETGPGGKFKSVLKSMTKQDSGPWVYIKDSHVGGLTQLKNEIDLGLLDEMKKVSDKEKEKNKKNKEVGLKTFNVRTENTVDTVKSPSDSKAGKRKAKADEIIKNLDAGKKKQPSDQEKKEIDSMTATIKAKILEETGKHKITVFSLKDCATCMDLRKYLSKEMIPFASVYLDDSSNRESSKEAFGRALI